MKMNDIIEKRKNGATYQEIADAEGVSKQWVNQIITKHAPELKYTRGHGFNIETIVYKGIYEHFKSDLHESVTSFTHKIYGRTCRNNISTVRRFIIGEHPDSRFSIAHIKKMCEITGKSFEELFTLREGVRNDR